jgi:hypothetical protein
MGLRERMGRIFKTWLLIVLGVCLWGWNPAWSADPAAPHGLAPEDPGRGERAAVTTGPLITDTTIPQALGTCNIQTTSQLAVTAGRFSPGWRRVGAGGDFRSWSLPLRITYGVAPRTEIYGVLQYVHNWAAEVSQPGPGGERQADFGGLGDVSFTYKYLLLEEKPAWPAVAGVFTVDFPTGHHRHLNPGLLGIDQLGRGAYTFTPGLNFYKFVDPVLLYGNLWYGLSTDATVAGQRLHYRDKVTLDLAMEYPLSRRWIFLLEYVSFYDGGRLLGPRADQPPRALLSVLPGLELIVSDVLSFTAGVQVDLFGRNVNCNYTPMLAAFINF